jgi:hypothetical protein
MAKSFVAIIPADPSDTFRRCGVDDCSIVSPHANVVVRGLNWVTYDYLHVWDYDGDIDASKLEKDRFGALYPKNSASA